MFPDNLENFPDNLVEVLEEAEIPEDLEQGSKQKIPTDFSQTINACEVSNITRSVGWSVGEAGG